MQFRTSGVSYVGAGTTLGGLHSLHLVIQIILLVVDVGIGVVHDGLGDAARLRASLCCFVVL